MVKKSIGSLALISFLILFISCNRASESAVSQKADLVIKNAKIVTIDKENPRAEAIAIKGEKILAVTSNKVIADYIEDGKTRILDAAGRLVIPGFNDAHTHFYSVDPDYIVAPRAERWLSGMIVGRRGRAGR